MAEVKGAYERSYYIGGQGSKLVVRQVKYSKTSRPHKDVGNFSKLVMRYEKFFKTGKLEKAVRNCGQFIILQVNFHHLYIYNKKNTFSKINNIKTTLGTESTILTRYTRRISPISADSLLGTG